MTAWGLLIHAQLTHNLKIFLEKASQSLLEQSKLSHFSPGTQFYGSQLQTMPSADSLQSEHIGIPIADSLQPSVSDLVSACVSNAVYGTAISSQQSALNTGKNICITTDYVTGNRNVLGRETGVLGTEMSQVSNQVNGRTLKGILYSKLPESDTSQSVQVHQKIVAVPCKQIKTPLAVQNTVQNILNPDLIINGPFRSRSNTLPNIPRNINDSNQHVVSSQQVVNSDTVMLPEKSADDKKVTDISPMQSRNSGAGAGCLKEDEMTGQKELRTESVDDGNLHEVGKSDDCALKRNIEHVEQSADIEQSANNIDTSSETEKLHENNTGNSELETVETERNTEEQENQDDSVDDEDDKIEPCCDNQGCGITVIPGSHQTLQKCCNAVVPKKRKRHFETKHMPFSWSSSRYAKRRLLQSSRDRQFPSCSSSKSGYNVQGGSTIYIDVEPDSFVSSLGKSTSSVESTVQVTQSQFSTPRISSVERSGRPRSLILRPGAVVSIPLTYTIPVSNSASLLMPGQVTQQPLASVPTQSHDTQTGTQSLSVDTKEAVEQSTDCSTASLVSTDNDSTDAFDIKPLIDGVSRRRKYPTSKPFKCEVCEVAFNQRIHLKKHMSKHTGVKPFKCGQCDYSTVERSHLKVHIRIHTGEKPFKCTYCEYATAQNSTLKIHLKRHHGGRMFQCPNCSKEFTQQTQLTDHEWEHSPPDSSSKQQINKASACKTVMKTEVFEDHSSQQENTSASSSHLKPPLQQEALTVSNANVGHVTPATNSSVAVGHVTPASGSNADLASHVTSATNSSTGLGLVIPSAIDSEELGHVIPATNGSTDSGHVMLATNSSTALNHVIPVSNSGTDLGHVIAIPSASSCMTDNEAAVLLNSLTAKLLEEAKQAAQSHTD